MTQNPETLDNLGHVVMAIERAAVRSKQRKIESDAWHAQWELEQKMRRYEEQAKEHNEAIESQLLTYAERYQQASSIRALINGMRTSSKMLSPEQATWLEWATTRANDIDPLTSDVDFSVPIDVEDYVSTRLNENSA